MGVGIQNRRMRRIKYEIKLLNMRIKYHEEKKSLKRI